VKPLKTKKYYVGRRDGVMKVFRDEKGATKYTTDSVALYQEESDSTLIFIRVVGIKATADEVARILQNAP
jgi:hypothetical protein